MGSGTNQSAVIKGSEAWKKARRKFRENALAMDYSEEEEGKDKIEQEIEKVSKEVKNGRKRS